MLPSTRRPVGKPVQLTAAVVTVLVAAAAIALALIAKGTYGAARAEQFTRQPVTARLLTDAGRPVLVPGAPMAGRAAGAGPVGHVRSPRSCRGGSGCGVPATR
ncbi:hypothetical protein Prum_068670 [Phytohabitans rumicis]|uniref:Uncharacterized protein n=1 Tax=Phytohabitans rumicis TaxID=1076125 RepID=A0A6V8LKQ4_9ACTN|nr:hypothetical protein Prum_068670 [Phytohabitans rumicis]